jgi:uncharacterized alkaline shock family protein YloU
MAEQTENTPNAEGAASGSSGGGSGRSSRAVSRSSSAVSSRGEGVLTSDRGTTSVSDAVVTKVASIAAREVAGVYELGGGTARAIGNVGQRVGLSTQRTQGVSVEVGEREAAIDLTLVLDYGESIPRVSQEVRDNVIKRIEGITGLSVKEVNIAVDDLYFPGDEAPAEPARVE